MLVHPMHAMGSGWVALIGKEGRWEGKETEENERERRVLLVKDLP